MQFVVIRKMKWGGEYIKCFGPFNERNKARQFVVAQKKKAKYSSEWGRTPVWNVRRLESIQVKQPKQLTKKKTIPPKDTYSITDQRFVHILED